MTGKFLCCLKVFHSCGAVGCEISGVLCEV